jgi:hypothetical protein
MEVLFLRLSFFEETTFYDNGFLQAFMAIGDFLTILKVGPAIFTECSGSPNVSKLNRVASPGPSTQPQPSTPPTPTNPFNDAVFTNSPVNFNDVRRANMALNDMIASGNPISSPAKKYITFLTQNVEYLQAINTIIQHKNEQLKAHVHGRKRQLSGKRQVINGKHHITRAELMGIQEAEKVMREKKEKQRNKALRKKRSKLQKESTDESGEELELSDDEMKDILDRIEVEL